LEAFIERLIALNPIWIYFVSGIISYIENIFPPFPSDVVLVAAGYLCATGQVNIWIVLIVSTLGGTLGFMSMYSIGFWFGMKVVEKGKLKFINLEKVHKVERWFKQYGYFVVVLNRFLAGTRAVIAFFTGISELSFWKTTILAAFSSLIWNGILLMTGNALGKNWRAVYDYLSAYGSVVTIVSLLFLGILIAYNIQRKQNKQNI
jgi:membrane protein DedA with SNARE-associated domain